MTVGDSNRVTLGVDRETPRERAISLRTLVMAVAVVACAWLAYQLFAVFLAVAVSLLLVGTLSPAIEWLEGRGVKRAWGIAIVFTAMLVTTVFAMALTIPSLINQVTTLVKQEPRIRDRLADFLAQSRVSAPLSESLRRVQYESLVTRGATMALDYSTRIASVAAYVVSAVFLALYMLIDRDRLRGGLFAVVPRSHHLRLSRILLNLETIVGGYIRGQVITSVLLAIFTFGLLTVCRVPNAIALAVFAGLADVLPYIGVFLSVGPACAAALSVSTVMALVVLVSLLVYEEFESRFLVPRVYGRALRLPSSVVLVALLAGGTLMGIPGAFLALPVAAAIRMLVLELRVDLPGEEGPTSTERARVDQAELEYERRAEGVPAQVAAAIAVDMTARERVHGSLGAEGSGADPLGQECAPRDPRRTG
jgi:predicted PurR-regulated permease PerM